MMNWQELARTCVQHAMKRRGCRSSERCSRAAATASRASAAPAGLWCRCASRTVIARDAAGCGGAPAHRQALQRAGAAHRDAAGAKRGARLAARRRQLQAQPQGNWRACRLLGCRRSRRRRLPRPARSWAELACSSMAPCHPSQGSFLDDTAVISGLALQPGEFLVRAGWPLDAVH